MGDRQLHVFEMGPDTVIAYDVEDAWAVWCERLGEKREDYEPWDEPAQLDDDKPLKIWSDSDGVICEPGEDGGAVATRTCREWADREGRGFLCSTEW